MTIASARGQNQADDAYERPHDRRPERVLVVLIALVPLVFVDVRIAGFGLTGWAWLAGLALAAPLVLAGGLSVAVVRRLTPYLGFLSVLTLGLAWAPSVGKGVATLAQLVAPAVVMALASRLPDPARLMPALRLSALLALLLAVAVIVASSVGALPASVPLSTRPTAIALIVLFILATLDSSRSRTAVLAALTLLASGSTGSRTATAVLLVAVVLSPTWRLRWRGRTALLLLAIVGVVAVSQTQAFQERFFFNERGTLRDALTGSSTLNTAGRRELWPRLAERCGEHPWLGSGPGAGSALSDEITFGVLGQPHNDYLRTYCDAGLVGAGLFWGFLVACGLTGARAAVRGDVLGGAAGQVVLALLLLAITDNVIIYTAHFMLPLAVVLGLAMRSAAIRRAGAPAG